MHFAMTTPCTIIAISSSLAAWNETSSSNTMQIGDSVFSFSENSANGVCTRGGGVLLRNNIKQDLQVNAHM